MTVRIHLGTEDLANVRFAFSAAAELLASLRVLSDPARHALHLPWVSQVRAIADDFPLLRAMVAPHGYVPDFITPTPEDPFPELADELERVRSAPEGRVKHEARAWKATLRERVLTGQVPLETGKRSMNLADSLIGETSLWIPAIADEMQRYWDAAVAPHWPRIRALLEGDVLYRARLLALEGPGRLFSDLNPRVTWDDGTLHVDMSWEHDENAAGKGLMLIPSAFVWPDVMLQVEVPQQPSVMYPPRGVVELWGPSERRDPGAMGELIGEARAAILRTLEQPMTTGEIATRLGVTPAAVSQQLAILRRSGVVNANRVGRGVYSSRTPLGEQLLQLLG